MTEYEAGEALDRLVAEKVMGWIVVFEGEYVERSPDGLGPREFVWVNTLPPVPGEYFTPNEEVKRRSINWSPSTNIAHAWEVVERLKLGVLPTQGGWVAGWESPTSHVNWYEEFTYGGVGTWCQASTAPLAICRAAMKTVGL